MILEVLRLAELGARRKQWLINVGMAVYQQAGEVIDEYKIRKQVREDTFRVLYSAYEIETGKPVDLAIVKPDFATSAQFMQDYLHRAQSLAQIRHPNLATVLRTGLTKDSQPYSALEPVDGYPLSERLRRLVAKQSPTHSQYALTLVRQLASGLGLLERLDIYHYELTPEKILLRSVTVKNEESLVLTDIDIPDDLVDLPVGEGDELRDYLSPEQRAGKAIDGRSHVYTFGVLLHELLGGIRPDRPLTVWTKTVAALRGGSTLSRIRPDLSPATIDLVEKSLAKNPRRRFRSVRAFLEALELALEAEDLRSLQVSENQQRMRSAYFFPLLVFLLCGAIGIAALLFDPNEPDQTASAALPATLTIAPPQTAMPTAAPTHTLSPVPTAITVKITESEAAVDATPSGFGGAVSGSPPANENSQPQEMATTVADQDDRDEATSAASEPTATSRPAETTSPTATAEPTVTPVASMRIAVSSANLRRGPGTVYQSLGFVLQDEELEIIARNSGDYTWLNVRTASGQAGWVALDVGVLVWPPDAGAIEEAATIPVPPTATFTPTATATPIPPTLTPEPSSGSPGGGGGGERPRATPTPPL